MPTKKNGPGCCTCGLMKHFGGCGIDPAGATVVFYRDGSPIASGVLDARGNIDISGLPRGVLITVTCNRYNAPYFVTPGQFTISDTTPPSVVGGGFTLTSSYTCVIPSGCSKLQILSNRMLVTRPDGSTVVAALGQHGWEFDVLVDGGTGARSGSAINGSLSAVIGFRGTSDATFVVCLGGSQCDGDGNFTQFTASCYSSFWKAVQTTPAP